MYGASSMELLKIPPPTPSTIAHRCDTTTPPLQSQRLETSDHTASAGLLPYQGPPVQFA